MRQQMNCISVLPGSPNYNLAS